ncbi:MAG: hypothetical protein ACR2RL_22560, partial [Gammaproteobacteria bacterium]
MGDGRTADGGAPSADPPRLVETPAGLALTGALTLRSVPGTYREATPLIEKSARSAAGSQSGRVELDLAGVGRSDSAAL